MQANMVLEKELIVLYPDLQVAEVKTESHTGYSLSIRDLKVSHHSDTLPPTRSHVLTVSLPMSNVFKKSSQTLFQN